MKHILNRRIARIDSWVDRTKVQILQTKVRIRFAACSNAMEAHVITQIIFTFVILAITSTLTFADGGNLSGGGDTQCEARLQKIQKNLAEWLNLKTKGPRLLDLGEIKFVNYIKGMRENVYTQIECTSDKVDIESIEKTCKFETKSPKTNEPLITCNTDRVDKTNDDNAYMLLHHEVAGLASMELPEGSLSKYDVISDQIAEFTGVVEVKKLGVNKRRTDVITSVSFYDAIKLKQLLILSKYNLPTKTVYHKKGVEKINMSIPEGAFVNVVGFSEEACALTLSYNKTRFEVRQEFRQFGINPETGKKLFFPCDSLPPSFGIYQY